MAQQRVQIVEVSPRDGLQAEPQTLPTATKLELLDRLADAGHTVIEATSFVSPTVVPQLADADDLMARLKRRSGVRYPVLVPNEKGLARAVAAGADEVAVFVSASESYARTNLRRSRDEAIGTALAVVESATARRLRVRAYVSMVIADPDDGPTDPAEVAKIAARFLAAGAAEVSLGDTIGAGTARHVRALLAAHRDAKIPVERLAVHFHDTYGQGLANVLTAIDLGVRVIDASIGGIGGSPFAKRAGGNLATEDVVWMLDGMGLATGLDVRRLAATTTWMAEQLGRELPGRAARAPLVVTELFRIFRDGIAAVLAIVGQHEYIALFGIVAIEEAGVPLPAPSDLVIMFYGDRARGDFGSLALVVLTCAVASTFGTLIPYLVTRTYGDAAAHRIAGWIDVDPKKVDEWEARIARRGFIAIFLGRLIPGLRVAMSLIGGTAKVPLMEFSAGVFAAGIIYWSFWTALGALFGPVVRRLIPRAYIEYIVIGIPVLVIGYLLFRYIRGRRRRSRSQAAPS